MPIYRFRILDETKHVIAGQYSHCKDDDAAGRHADILAVKRRSSNIVIWDEDRPVPRERPDPSPDTPPSSQGEPRVAEPVVPLSSSELIRRAEETIARSRELREETLLLLGSSRAVYGRSVALMSTISAKPKPPSIGKTLRFATLCTR